MKLLVNKYKFINTIILIAVLFYLEYIYKTFIFNRFEYMGFMYNFDILKYFETKLLFFSTLLITIYKTRSKFIYSIITIFSLFLLIPNLIIFEFTDAPRIVSYSIVFFILTLHLVSFSKTNIKFPKISENQSLYLIIIIMLIFLVPIITQYGFKLNFNVLKFQDIYEVRRSASEGASSISSYLYNWLSKVIIPIIITFSLIKKKYIVTTIGVMVLLYLFVTQAHKSVFFGIIIVLFFFFFKNYYKKISFFLIILFSVFIITHLLTVLTGAYAPESILVRRVFFVPALLNTYYFDFFRDNYIYLSHSIFSFLFEYPYEVPPPSVIGLEYFNSVNTHANNGFISDGFMNFGMIGVFIYSILIVLLIKSFDLLKLDSRYFGVFFVMIFTLISSAFLTSLLTHGILILMLMAIFVMQKNKDF